MPFLRLSQQAFSFLEMLICFSIISILCAISLPGLMSFYERLENEMFLSELLNTITFAHHVAIIKNVPVAICMSSNHESCGGEWQEGQIVFIDTYRDGSVRKKEQMLAIKQGVKNRGVLHYRSFPYYRDYLLFTPKGWLLNDNGTFWFCAKKNDTAIWAIVLAKSGKARVIYPDKNGELKDSHGHSLACSSQNKFQNRNHSA